MPDVLEIYNKWAEMVAAGEMSCKCAEKAVDWGSILNMAVSPSALTSLVIQGLVERFKYDHERAYHYRFIPTEELKKEVEKSRMLEAIKACKRNRNLQEELDKYIARKKAEFEEDIERQRRWISESIESGKKRYAECKAKLEEMGVDIDAEEVSA